MTSIHIQLHNLIDRMVTTSNQSYIKEMIGSPSLPIFFIKLLFMMMKATEIPFKRIENYCIATGLLQMGLSIHDKITMEEQLPLQQMRMRQLIVLSGDYYTSLFYQRLATYQEIEGIHFLSQVVRSINETKMAYYTEHGSQMDLHIQSLKRLQYIESGLLTSLVDFFHTSKKLGSIWKTVGANFLLIHILIQHPDWYCRLTSESILWIEECWFALRQAVLEIQTTEIREQLLQWIHQQQFVVDEFLCLKKG